MSTSTGTCWLTPPAIAEQLGIDPLKVISWIRSGELRAIDVAAKTSSRPRWRVSQVAFNDFLQRREARPAVKPARKRRKAANIIEFF